MTLRRAEHPRPAQKPTFVNQPFRRLEYETGDSLTLHRRGRARADLDRDDQAGGQIIMLLTATTSTSDIIQAYSLLVSVLALLVVRAGPGFRNLGGTAWVPITGSGLGAH